MCCSRERENSSFEKCGICAHQFPEDLAKPRLKYHYSRVEMREAAHCLMRWWWKPPCRLWWEATRILSSWINLGWQMSPQLWWLVLDCHAAPPGKKKKKCFCATALIKNGWLCFALLSSLSFHVFCRSLFFCIAPSFAPFFVFPPAGVEGKTGGDGDGKKLARWSNRWVAAEEER